MIVNAVYSAATPEGVAKAQADREARWGDGCHRCPVIVVADITKGPILDIADASAVVFVSCVFEYSS